MLNDRENILNVLREKPLKVYEIMKGANVANEEVCQSLLLKMRGEGSGEIRYSQWAMAHRMIRESHRRCPRRFDQRVRTARYCATRRHFDVASG